MEKIKLKDVDVAILYITTSTTSIFVSQKTDGEIIFHDDELNLLTMDDVNHYHETHETKEEIFLGLFKTVGDEKSVFFHLQNNKDQNMTLEEFIKENDLSKIDDNKFTQFEDEKGGRYLFINKYMLNDPNEHHMIEWVERSADYYVNVDEGRIYYIGFCVL